MAELAVGGGGAAPFGQGGWTDINSGGLVTSQTTFNGLGGGLYSGGRGGSAVTDQSTLYGGNGAGWGQDGGSAWTAAGPYSGPRGGGAGGPVFVTANGSADYVFLNTGTLLGRYI